jgi:hypothetical protein
MVYSVVHLWNIFLVYGHVDEMRILTWFSETRAYFCILYWDQAPWFFTVSGMQHSKLFLIQIIWQILLRIKVLHLGSYRINTYRLKEQQSWFFMAPIYKPLLVLYHEAVFCCTILMSYITCLVSYWHHRHSFYILCSLEVKSLKAILYIFNTVNNTAVSTDMHSLTATILSIKWSEVPITWSVK